MAVFDIALFPMLRSTSMNLSINESNNQSVSQSIGFGDYWSPDDWSPDDWSPDWSSPDCSSPDCSSRTVRPGLFIPWTVCPTDCLSHGLFIPLSYKVLGIKNLANNYFIYPTS